MTANQSILRLCEGLDSGQLDESREMGLGSLRNTVFHILVAEQVWLDRWLNRTPGPFAIDANGMTIEDIGHRLSEVSASRREFLEQNRANGWSTFCNYNDIRGNAHTNDLRGLLLHVANHGIHHRAQALNYLKRIGRTVPGGIDYLFFRLANPVIKQTSDVVAKIKHFGMRVEEGDGAIITFHEDVLKQMFQYGDWANQRVLEQAGKFEQSQLDHDFGIGLGTLRKNLLHIHDAERWWLKNWTIGASAFERSPETTSLAQLESDWKQTIQGRNGFLSSLSPDSALRIVKACVGPMELRVFVIESLVQLFGHGTHHRAQVCNMLRQSGMTPQPIDFVVWMRQR
jgi:uncharacterized damage-inducible protein DinB